MTKTYDASFKLQVVLESFQRDRTIEQVRSRYGIAPSVLHKWRKIFKNNAHLVFESTVSNKTKPKDSESPEQLKAIIGDLSVENALLKKALSVWD
jgi:transposase-like protein